MLPSTSLQRISKSAVRDAKCRLSEDREEEVEVRFGSKANRLPTAKKHRRGRNRTSRLGRQRGTGNLMGIPKKRPTVDTVSSSRLGVSVQNSTSQNLFGKSVSPVKRMNSVFQKKLKA